MSWRTVVITNRSKLDFKMGYMVVRGPENYRVFLGEIAILLIENPAVSLTGILMEELVNRKIKVIFCDKTRNPVAEVNPYYGSHDCSKKVKLQIAWSAESKGKIWREIVSDKILKQSELLEKIGKFQEARMLKNYISEITDYDVTNREGHAAKVYFNALFGKSFSRGQDNVTNAALNYGYSIILSAFNREIISNGYITQLGLFHDNIFNQFNLGCDFMEPFRILVDRHVYYGNIQELTSHEKYMLIDILNESVIINGSKQTALNAIKIYTKSIFDALNEENENLIKRYSYGL